MMKSTSKYSHYILELCMNIGRLRKALTPQIKFQKLKNFQVIFVKALSKMSKSTGQNMSVL